MRKLFLTLALASIALVSMAPAMATHSVTKAYDFSFGANPGIGGIVTVPGIGGTVTVPGKSLGGANFAAPGEVPLSVDVADASGGAVAVTVCQDPDGAICGEAGEPRVIVCGTHADLALSEVPFDAGLEISVFIRTHSTSCPGGVATSGTITMNYGESLE